MEILGIGAEIGPGVPQGPALRVTYLLDGPCTFCPVMLWDFLASTGLLPAFFRPVTILSYFVGVLVHAQQGCQGRDGCHCSAEVQAHAPTFEPRVAAMCCLIGGGVGGG